MESKGNPVPAPPAIVQAPETAAPEYEEVELTLLKPEPNLPENDQRTHVVLTDERFMDNLGRVPKGLHKDVSSVMLAIKGWRDEIARLKAMEKIPPDKRGNIRVLKDTTSYFTRELKPGVAHPVTPKRTFWQVFIGKKPPTPKSLTDEDYIVTERRVGIYTVLPSSQIKHYRRKFERQTAQALDWVYRIMRLWVGEGGKGRTEMIDALQASNGKLMPAEAGRGPMIINMPSNTPGHGGWAKNR